VPSITRADISHADDNPAHRDVLALALCVANFAAALGIRPDPNAAAESREFQADGKLDRPSALPGTAPFVRPPSSRPPLIRPPASKPRRTSPQRHRTRLAETMPR
jgi:hypothetical protein